MRNKIILISVLTLVIVAASFFIFTDEEEIPVAQESPPPKVLNIYVSGQVKTTAVVELEDNGNLRAIDAINAVGGLTEFADTEKINLAEILIDGQHIHIPTKEIFLRERADKVSSSLININTADENELQNIKGIGPAISRRIVEYRKQNGNFSSIEDIKKVRGIGNKTFEKMKDSITVQ